LFEAGTISELENLLKKLITKEVPLLGKEAREEILKNWSSKKEAESLIKVYQS